MAEYMKVVTADNLVVAADCHIASFDAGKGITLVVSEICCYCVSVTHFNTTSSFLARDRV